MVEAFKNAVLLDNWINTQAFKYAYNEKTSGFIGKRSLKERVLSAVPREFIALGHTREKVGLRLNEMLANDLTQALVRECDERRTKSTQPEATALGNLLYVIGDKGVSTTSVNATDTFGTTRSTSTHNPSTITPGASTTIVRKFGAAAAAGTGSQSIFGPGPRLGPGFGSRGGFQGNAPDKGKNPTSESESEDEDDGNMHEAVVFSTLGDEPNQKFVPASPVSEVDHAIADFVELPNLPKAHSKGTSKSPAVGDSEDIFSRRGSSPQRSRSSSIFIPPPPPPPPPPLDLDIPFLPFKLQYRILVILQSTLESVCYDFARKHYPEFLIRKGWDCPEAGELTHWTRGLIAEFRDSPTRAVREADHFPAALKGIDEIRHSTVHRVPMSGRDIQRLIQKSKVVLNMLDSTRRMCDQIDGIDGIIERNIHTVLDKRRQKEEKLRLELEKLEEWKRILELREVRAIKQAEYEEEHIQKSFRDEVGQALKALGVEESVVYSVNAEPDPGNGSFGDTKETDRVEDSMPAHDEEYFHESEGW